jgi:5,10-methylenetetrahydrofolate reductase
MVKLIDQINAADASGTPYVAFEFFPPRTAEGVANLYKRFRRMAQQSASISRHYEPVLCA